MKPWQLQSFLIIRLKIRPLNDLAPSADRGESKRAIEAFSKALMHPINKCRLGRASGTCTLLPCLGSCLGRLPFSGIV